MDFQIYLDRLENLLKEELRNQDFIDSGALLDSIEFKMEVTPLGVEIELGANDYIKYLDNGIFIEDFFNSPQVNQILEEASDAWVESQLENI